MTINLSRFQEFARENLGLGLLGGAGTAEVNIKYSSLFSPLTPGRERARHRETQETTKTTAETLRSRPRRPSGLGRLASPR